MLLQDEAKAPKPVKQLDYRYEGIAKVTGKIKYAAEFTEPFNKADLTYGYVVQSTIASGTLTAIDTTAAMRAPGVNAVQCAEAAGWAAATAGASQPEPASGYRRALQRTADRGGGGEDAGSGAGCGAHAEDQVRADTREGEFYGSPG